MVHYTNTQTDSRDPLHKTLRQTPHTLHSQTPMVHYKTLSQTAMLHYTLRQTPMVHYTNTQTDSHGTLHKH